ncbi:MAG: tRNA (5-methylaminomethyl-2-thiouridine)(34)-methyltransferase MnmD, partial [Pirellulaceae bacterium]|nr:tRNA (5-methylaminomethyl-2-thiouridine)(34)-methyltransferase MnmD [Pirellulaceae bacterium]
MAIPKRPTTQTSAAGLHWQVTDDGSRTLWDQQLDETYHSGCGAVAESLVVYLLNSGMHKRLAAGQGSAVLEYGLGTATAFLLTAADALIHGAALHYRALEISLLPAEILGELQLCGSTLHPAYRQEFGEVLEVAQSLLAEFVQWRSKLAVTPEHGMYNCALRANIELEIVIGNAVHYDRADLFDAIYFDPFSPASCPELWSVAVFRHALNGLHAGGTLTSYCVKSSVRHDLSSVGFRVSRVPGPIGGKREVLLATKVPALE